MPDFMGLKSYFCTLSTGLYAQYDMTGLQHMLYRLAMLTAV
jgi:hypothetical protein